MRSSILTPALAAALLFTACSPGAGQNVTPAPTTPTATVAATPGEEAAAFAAFRIHVAAESAKVSTLMTTFATDAGKGNVAAVKKDAATIRAWAKAEAAWLDTAPNEFCFANVFLLWDVVREHADLAATDALAGRYEQAASEIDTMTTTATNTANAIRAAVCP
jgi:hypothetical protein